MERKNHLNLVYVYLRLGFRDSKWQGFMSGTNKGFTKVEQSPS